MQKMDQCQKFQPISACFAYALSPLFKEYGSIATVLLYLVSSQVERPGFCYGDSSHANNLIDVTCTSGVIHVLDILTGSKPSSYGEYYTVPCSGFSVIIPTGFIPLSPLSIVSKIVMWERILCRVLVKRISGKQG